MLTASREHSLKTVHPHARGDNAAAMLFQLWYAVHPHARGDNCISAAPAHGGSGSPPRPWGQFHLADRPGGIHRFTPTPVGTIAEAGVKVNLVAVHPHARGDNQAERAGNREPDGSPPRPWGQSAAAPHVADARRFTPTPVGTI